MNHRSETDQTPTLAAIRLSVSLSARSVLTNMDFAADRGSLTAVIGPNGAGKSTLLRTLAGLIEPDRGSVTLGGRPMTVCSRIEVARQLAYLPQDRLVHWPMAVEAVVALGRHPHRRLGAGLGAADRRAIAAAISAMDLDAMAARPVSTLSGGERARVLVARALAQQPQILLADEPTAGLDPAHQLTLFEHLRAIAAAGCCVVVALHDLSLAARFCDSILLLKDGKRLAFGPPQDVFTPSLLAVSYGIKAQVADLGGVPVVLPLETLA